MSENLPAAQAPSIAYRLEKGMALIGKSGRSGYRLWKSGKLRTYLDGGLRMVSHAALVEYVQGLEREAHNPAEGSKGGRS